MSAFENPLQFSQDLMQVNRDTFTRLAEASVASVRKGVETYRAFGERLPEVKSPTDLMELQRDFGSAVWRDVQAAAEARAEIYRDALERSGAVWRGAFGVAPEAAVDVAAAAEVAADAAPVGADTAA